MPEGDEGERWRGGGKEGGVEFRRIADREEKSVDAFEAAHVACFQVRYRDLCREWTRDGQSWE